MTMVSFCQYLLKDGEPWQQESGTSTFLHALLKPSSLAAPEGAAEAWEVPEGAGSAVHLEGAVERATDRLPSGCGSPWPVSGAGQLAC